MPNEEQEFLVRDPVYHRHVSVQEIVDTVADKAFKLVEERLTSCEQIKASYIGAPACFKLELACKHINDAFGMYGCYLVGSAARRPDWRDVDIRLIMPDDEFEKLFPTAGNNCEFDQRWLLLITSISAWMSEQTSLPIDFQFQKMSKANETYKGRPRSALGIMIKEL